MKRRIVHKSWVVYLHRNKINNKVYVGYTSATVLIRWRRHVWNSQNSTLTHFYKALKKYGSSDDIWEHVVLSKHESFEETKLAEIAEIEQFKSNQHEFGYNSTKGGDGCSGPKTENTKEKIRLGRIGKCTGEVHPMFHNHPRRKLDVADVIKIKESNPKIFHKDLAEKFHVSIGSIYKIRIGESWKHVRPDLTRDRSAFYHWHNGHTVKTHQTVPISEISNS